MAVRRTGLTKIMTLALTLCKSIGFFTPIIEKVYPESTALHAALASANAACAVLVEEADNVLPDGQ